MPGGNLSQAIPPLSSRTNTPPEKGRQFTERQGVKENPPRRPGVPNACCKVIPHIVDGPLATQLIKPKPTEIVVDGPRDPSTWRQVSKVARGRRTSACALLECDVDVGVSNRKIRKILNIVWPHIESVMADVALIVGAPTFQEEEEPSAWLGLWRIEKVDFGSAAVFPELAVEDATEKVKFIMSTMSASEEVKVAA